MSLGGLEAERGRQCEQQLPVDQVQNRWGWWQLNRPIHHPHRHLRPGPPLRLERDRKSGTQMGRRVHKPWRRGFLGSEKLGLSVLGG